MSILTTLRSIGPRDRPLRPTEARSIAERQARRFRILTGYDDQPMLPSETLTTLPRINVQLAVSMKNHAGMSGWDPIKRRYDVLINGHDAPTRQRFTLAHEYKHIIDYHTHQATYRSFGAYSAHDQAEDICDYFAGYLLIPRHLLKAAWADGIQTTRDLAELFGVSKAAIRVRLSQTGLVETSRHRWFMRRSRPSLRPLPSTARQAAEVLTS